LEKVIPDRVALNQSKIRRGGGSGQKVSAKLKKSSREEIQPRGQKEEVDSPNFERAGKFV